MGIRINRVYTRSGDDGETGLVGGRRVQKDDLRVHAYGDVDELNSVLGLVKARVTSDTRELSGLVEFLQQELFDLGSELATAPEDSYPQMWKAGAEHTARLEKLCDRYCEGLPELSSFILPGGSELAASLHVARTVCRRAERTVVSLQAKELQAELKHVAIYLNRLSDLLFILARWSLEQQKINVPLWTKGEARKAPI